MPPSIFTIIIYIFLAEFAFFIVAFHKYANQTQNWLILYLWLISVILTASFVMKKLPSKIYKKALSVVKQDATFLSIVIFLAIFTRFFILNAYPSVAVGDMVRDAGLWALRIYQGQLKDFFAFGSYQGYGNFTPLISYYFLLLVGNSKLAFLIPSAIASVLSILLTYFVIRIWSGRIAAFVGSLFLIGSFIHLHYSRTELLIIIDSLLSLVMIATLYLTSYSIHAFLIFGLAAGLIFHFYAATRGILFALIAYVIATHLLKLIRLAFQGKWTGLFIQMKLSFLSLLIFSIGFFIGLGPTINRINNSNLFANIGTTKLILYNEKFRSMPFFEKVEFFFENYKKSLLVYVAEPTPRFRFNYQSPMLSFPLNIFFLFGIFFILTKKRNIIGDILIISIFVLPITNQVLINQIGYHHRMVGIIPLINMVAAFGFTSLLAIKIRKQNLRLFLGQAFTVIFLLNQLRFYFLERPSDLGYEQQDFIFEDIVNYIRNGPSFQKYYIVNNETYRFDLLHNLEKIEFFTYPKEVKVIDQNYLSTILSGQRQPQGKVAFIVTAPTKKLVQQQNLQLAIMCGSESPTFYGSNEIASARRVLSATSGNCFSVFWKP